MTKKQTENNMNIKPSFATAENAALILGIPEHAIRKGIHENKFAYLKSGKRVLINLEDCEKYFKGLSFEYAVITYEKVI